MPIFNGDLESTPESDQGSIGPGIRGGWYIDKNAGIIPYIGYSLMIVTYGSSAFTFKQDNVDTTRFFGSRLSLSFSYQHTDYYHSCRITVSFAETTIDTFAFEIPVTIPRPWV